MLAGINMKNFTQELNAILICCISRLLCNQHNSCVKFNVLKMLRILSNKIQICKFSCWINQTTGLLVIYKKMSLARLRQTFVKYLCWNCHRKFWSVISWELLVFFKVILDWRRSIVPFYAQNKHYYLLSIPCRPHIVIILILYLLLLSKKGCVQHRSMFPVHKYVYKKDLRLIEIPHFAKTIDISTINRLASGNTSETIPKTNKLYSQ